jgi:hypothetical protein
MCLEGGQDLLMDPTLELHAGQVAEQLNMIHSRSTRRGAIFHELNWNHEADDVGRCGQGSVSSASNQAIQRPFA